MLVYTVFGLRYSLSSVDDLGCPDGAPHNGSVPSLTKSSKACNTGAQFSVVWGPARLRGTGGARKDIGLDL